MSVKVRSAKPHVHFVIEKRLAWIRGSSMRAEDRHAGVAIAQVHLGTRCWATV